MTVIVAFLLGVLVALLLGPFDDFLPPFTPA